MNREAFYNGVRNSFGPLGQKQVVGINAILDECGGLPLFHVAYILATAWHETGGKMTPNRENMTYTTAARIKEVFSPERLQGIAPSKLVRSGRKLANVVYGGEWGEEHLGNTQDGDGWKYRGNGFAHDTGRANHRKASAATSLDLLSDPELMKSPDIAARVMVAGMSTGWYRGPKLSDYKHGDYRNMRDIINADKKANGATVANYARQFEKALKSGGWGDAPKVIKGDVPVKPKRHWLIALIMSIFMGVKNE